jgi:membrane-bound lytic murein transglycosylase B
MITRRAFISRRACLSTLASAGALMLPFAADARIKKTAVPAKKLSFDEWVAAFRAKAAASGISEATYTRVMRGSSPT